MGIEGSILLGKKAKEWHDRWLLPRAVEWTSAKRVSLGQS